MKSCPKLKVKLKLPLVRFVTGIVISKKGIEITQTLEKALQLAHGRRMAPTLAGIPLDFQYRSAAVVKMTAAATMDVGPSIFNLLQFQKLIGGAQIMPRYVK